MVEELDAPPVDVAAVLRRAEAEVLVSYLPVGAEAATRWYAEQALAAGCAFVNCIPVFIASDPAWAARFEARRLPIIGDDIKSQVGATIVHRMLANLFRERGVRLDRTYQLNFGGNTDFMNMLERDRLESKKLSKTRAVTSQLAEPLSDALAHVGPSDYVPWLEDRKWCYIRMEGTTFGNVPLNCELKLEVWDSPNSAGVVIDAVRCAKLALDRGIGGALTSPSSYFMKSPPRTIHRPRGATAHRGLHPWRRRAIGSHAAIVEMTRAAVPRRDLAQRRRHRPADAASRAGNADGNGSPTADRAGLGFRPAIARSCDGARRGAGSRRAAPACTDGSRDRTHPPHSASSTMRPRYMIATRSDRCSTTPRSWLMNR